MQNVKQICILLEELIVEANNGRPIGLEKLYETEFGANSIENWHEYIRNVTLRIGNPPYTFVIFLDVPIQKVLVS